MTLKTGKTDGENREKKNGTIANYWTASAKATKPLRVVGIVTKSNSGRDRWNVGRISAKAIKMPFGILKNIALQNRISRLIESFGENRTSCIATSPSNYWNWRIGSPFPDHLNFTRAQPMVLQWDETIKTEVEQIKGRHAKTLANLAQIELYRPRARQKNVRKIHSH